MLSTCTQHKHKIIIFIVFFQLDEARVLGRVRIFYNIFGSTRLWKWKNLKECQMCLVHCLRVIMFDRTFEVIFFLSNIRRQDSNDNYETFSSSSHQFVWCVLETCRFLENFFVLRKKHTKEVVLRVFFSFVIKEKCRCFLCVYRVYGRCYHV